MHDSSQKEIDIHDNTSLTKYIERLPKLVKITGHILDDIKDLQKAVSEKHRQNTPSVNRLMSMRKYIDRLPKLFRITGDVLNDVKDLEKDVNELHEDSSHSEMLGSGTEDQNQIEDLSDDVDRLFLKMLDLEKTNKNKDNGIEYMEKAFDNTLQMIELFKNNMYSDIKYKIKELRSAALIALKMLKRSNEAGKANQDLLHKLVNASIFEGKELLKNNFETLQMILISYQTKKNFCLQLNR